MRMPMRLPIVSANSVADEGAQAVSIRGVATGRVRRCRPRHRPKAVPLRDGAYPEQPDGCEDRRRPPRQLVAAVEEGRAPAARPSPNADVLTFRELAARWQRANRPRQNQRTGQWIGWSPKTAKTHADNFRAYILPTLGDHDVAGITGLDLDELYSMLESELGLSPAVVTRDATVRCARLFSSALRKKLMAANPALSADPPA
jgi:hypothetical protein